MLPLPHALGSERVSEQDFQLKMSFFSLSQEADVAQCVND